MSLQNMSEIAKFQGTHTQLGEYLLLEVLTYNLKILLIVPIFVKLKNALEYITFLRFIARSSSFDSVIL
jgi:hypothetical protein